MDAEDLMEKLFAYGHKIIHLPTLKISSVKTELINSDNFDAFIFTSANAVRNLKLARANKVYIVFVLVRLLKKLHVYQVL